MAIRHISERPDNGITFNLEELAEIERMAADSEPTLLAADLGFNADQFSYALQHNTDLELAIQRGMSATVRSAYRALNDIMSGYDDTAKASDRIAAAKVVIENRVKKEIDAKALSETKNALDKLIAERALLLKQRETDTLTAQTQQLTSEEKMRLYESIKNG